MIRPFEANDRDIYLAMSHEFYRSPAVLHGIPEEYMQATFDTIVAGSPYAQGFLVLADDGQVAGYALISLTFSAEVGGLVVLVEELYIRPAFQGHGLGKSIFAFLEQRFAGSARRYRLEVTKENAGALRLYQRMGYQPLDYLQMVKE